MENQDGPVKGQGDTGIAHCTVHPTERLESLLARFALIAPSTMLGLIISHYRGSGFNAATNSDIRIPESSN